MIVFDFDTTEMAELLEAVKAVPGDLETATARAINKALTSTKTEMVRLVVADYAVKVGAVRKEINVTKAAPNRLEGKVHGAGSPGIPLKEFARTKAVPSTTRVKSFERTKAGYLTRGFRPKVGIPVLIRKDKGKLAASGVFLARMKSGHVGAFKRDREKIHEAYGPSPVKILASDRYDEHLDDFAGEVMEQELERQAELLLSKRGLK